jgi:hypothetical protein
MLSHAPGVIRTHNLLIRSHFVRLQKRPPVFAAPWKEKAGEDRSDKSGGPGTNRWMKEQANIDTWLFGRSVHVSERCRFIGLIPGRHSGFGVSIRDI